MGIENEFKPVNFDQERERAFTELAHRSVLVTAWTPTSKPLFFHVASVSDSQVRLTLVDGDGLSGHAGDSCEVLFSLDDGQYYWATTLEAASAQEWTLAMSGQLSRMQRRNNFRTQIPKGQKALLLLRSFKTHSVQPTDVSLIDVSAGGARLAWPAGLSQVTQGDTLSGVITAPGGRQVEVFGLVKSVLTDIDTKAVQVGIEFQNLSGRDEQALLHLCLQIRRAQTPALR